MITLSIRDFPENATMANVMVALGVFPSITQARKNGWNDPISLGKHILTKKKIEVLIVDDNISDKNKINLKKEQNELTKEPSFWNNFEEPTSHISRAMQFPDDERFFSRMILASFKDDQERRKKNGQNEKEI